MKKALSVGLKPYPIEGFEVVHCPLIKVVSLPIDKGLLGSLPFATHLVFTSKTAVEFFPLCDKPVLAVGQATGRKALEKGFKVANIAENETQEGVVDLVKVLSKPRLFWPRSTGARPFLSLFCKENGIALDEMPLYRVDEIEASIPSLEGFDALFFSSPSSVDAFLSKKISIPEHLQLLSIGDVTNKYLIDRLSHLGGVYGTPYVIDRCNLPQRLPASANLLL